MAWRYGWFAERYKWPPSVVDAQPLWVMLQFPAFASAYDQAQATRAERARALQELEAKRG